VPQRRKTVMRDGAHPVDIAVGNRIRVQRMMKGWSQERLADFLGLTFQQVQKYERGMNRVSASRLYEISQAFDVPIPWFFEGVVTNPSDFVDWTQDAAVMEMVRLLTTFTSEQRARLVSLLRSFEPDPECGAAT
jgi:transcriptional regulator with XRE-family HTH domain